MLTVGPSVDIWGQRAQVIAPLGAVGGHTHAATALLISLDDAFGFRPHGARQWLRRRCYLVPAGMRHALDCGRSRIAALFFAPGTADLEHLAKRFDLSAETKDPSEVERVADHLRPALHARAQRLIDAHDLSANIESLLGPHHQRTRVADRRLDRVLREVCDAPDTKIQLRDAAARVGLSAVRLRELARHHTGTSIQAYRRWQRMRKVTQRVAHGVSLTQAAHELGFTDSAQLSRDFRAAFGIPPSRVIRPGFDLHDHGDGE